MPEAGQVLPCLPSHLKGSWKGEGRWPWQVDWEARFPGRWSLADGDYRAAAEAGIPPPPLLHPWPPAGQR